MPIDFFYRCQTIERMESIGKRIKSRRKELKLSQVQVATICGIDQSTLSDIERDVNTGFSGTVLIKMADALQTSPQFIIHGQEAHQRLMDEADIIAAYRRSSAEGRSALLAMARALAASPARTPDPKDNQ